MTIRGIYWVVALCLAVVVHAMVLLYEKPASVKGHAYGADAAGIGGLSIGLGRAGRLITKVAVIAAPVTKTVAPVIPPKPVEIKKPIPKPKPVVKKPKPIKKIVKKPKKIKPKKVKPKKVKLKPVKAVILPTPIEPTPQVVQSTPIVDSIITTAKLQTTNTSVVPSGNGGQGSNASAGGNPGATKSYHAQIIAILSRNKRYPRRAKRRNQQGLVKVSFQINEDGSVTEGSIISSSGHKLLDKEVLALLKRISPLPPIPSELDKRSIFMELPVEFSLH